MTEDNNSWFHCGRCGSLFQSYLGESDGRVCASCGSNPALSFEIHPSAESDSGETPPDNPNERIKQPLRKRKSNYFFVKLLCGWALFIVLIIFAARHKWPAKPETPKPIVNQKAVAPETVEKDNALLNEVGSLCNRAFSGYLAARTPEERNQFVLRPVTTAARMNRFYNENPSINFDPSTFKLAHGSVIHLPSGPAIEYHWTSSEGYQLDSVFVKENDEWRLDWDHFARYSDYPWPLFLAGSGSDFAEFRLLARERLAEERKNADAISIVLYAPRFGNTMETGFQSPEFLIRRDTRNGQLLDAAFKLMREDKRVFGARFPNNNPEGFIRVRVKVRRFEEDLERRFELVEVIACHWYSVDAPGVEIPEPPASK